MGAIGIFFCKTYRVLAWDFPQAREKAADLALSEGLEVVRFVDTSEVF